MTQLDNDAIALDEVLRRDHRPGDPLADRMCASFGGIMHLVKDADAAWAFFCNALAKAADRAAEAGYPS